MSSIWEITRTALVGLGVPLAANRYLVQTGQDLPDRYIVYQLISSPPELSADNVEKYRSYRMQVTIWDRTGLAALPDIAGAMVAAGFGRGPFRELPYQDATQHYGLALDFFYLQDG